MVFNDVNNDAGYFVADPFERRMMARALELAAKAEFAITKQNFTEAQAIVQELDRLKTRLAGERATNA